MSKSQEPRNAEAGKRQQQYLKDNRRKAAATFSTEGLTNKNEDYMYQLNKQLEKSNVTYTKKQELLQATLKQIKEGQKTGKTARAMFGTPTQHAHDLLHPKKKDTNQSVADQSTWLLAADNALIFFAIFTGMFAIMSWISPKSLDVSINGSSGITAIVVISILGGLIFAVVAKMMMPRKVNGKVKRRPFWQRTLVVLGGLVLWMVIYFGGNILPNAINPRPNRYVYLVCALVGLGGDIYFRRRYHVSGILGSTQRPQKKNN